MSTATRAERFHRARRDPELTVLEGFHALKHALRFGAEVLDVSAVAPERVIRLCEKLAPDLVVRFTAAITDTVNDEELARLVPRPPFTGVIAIARRRTASAEDALASPGPAPAIALIAPRHAGNLGAAVRVAAAAGAAGLVSVNGRDPWEPEAVRGAAGLQYALPVARADSLPASDRPLVAVDPAGDPLSAEALPERALLAFGSERDGLGADVLSRADLRIAIPMRAGVSSLNLATAVAVVLYAGRWRG
ncbi:MAG TPA: TrmH family RNA methyltransferase [Gemmatimonadota bacterium]|nr:TrmH family RNA methyltransferase [Gemmatimonadota bacterium]